MKSLRKKLFLSILAVAFAVVSLATSTFAWFSMNQKVTVSGMSVTTKVSSNLMIAAGTAGTATAGEANFGTSINQISSGIIEPVSTVNGVDFFYTTSGKANGDSSAEDYKLYEESQFQSDYGVNDALAYVDYVFELKAINTDTSSSKYIDLTKMDLVYTGTANDTQKAMRTAIFVQNAATFAADGITVSAYEAFPSSAKCIMDITGSENQTADYAVSAASTAPTAISIMATKALTSIEVAANSTKYFKVTIRLYLEGEDKTCTNATFLALTDAWRLEVQYELKDSADSSITEISKFTAKTLKLNNVDTLLYYDGTDLFKAEDMTQLNVGTKIASATLTAEELTALNSAFSSSYTRE